MYDIVEKSTSIILARLFLHVRRAAFPNFQLIFSLTHLAYCWDRIYLLSSNLTLHIPCPSHVKSIIPLLLRIRVTIKATPSTMLELQANV